MKNVCVCYCSFPLWQCKTHSCLKDEESKKKTTQEIIAFLTTLRISLTVNNRNSLHELSLSKQSGMEVTKSEKEGHKGNKHRKGNLISISYQNDANQ